MRTIPLTLLASVLVGLLLPAFLAANELEKIKDEYLRNPIRRYQPNDPWNRSLLYRIQTGHYGKFYNCDNEEQKRCSPYVCWKNSDCPKIYKKRFLDCVADDVCEVRQRICDGAGPCCNHCRNTRKCNACRQTPVVQQPQYVAGKANIFQPVAVADEAANTKKQCDCEECLAKRQTSQYASQVSNAEPDSPGLLSRVRRQRTNIAVEVPQQRREFQQGAERTRQLPWQAVTGDQSIKR